MYTDEQINELFKNKIPQDKESQAYFSAYINIYKLMPIHIYHT